jgi:hypothetical protein
LTDQSAETHRYERTPPLCRENVATCEDGIPASPLAEIEAWAAGLSVPAYAIDDQTAIKVLDGTVEVVSEGHWRRFTASESR